MRRKKTDAYKYILFEYRPEKFIFIFSNPCKAQTALLYQNMLRKHFGTKISANKV